MKKIKKITICSSADFYKEVITIQKQLQDLGFKVFIPKTATLMKKNNDFEVSHYKTWVKTGNYTKKKQLMDGHFKKVLQADAILVVNSTKNGYKGYIGGNVLLEMFLAYLHKKPIFILRKIDEKLPLKEEIYGLFPQFINKDLGKIE